MSKVIVKMSKLLFPSEHAETLQEPKRRTEAKLLDVYCYARIAAALGRRRHVSEDCNAALDGQLIANF
jgi:hypothetical protein